MGNFDTYADMMNGTASAGSGFTQVSVSSAFQIVGFAYEPEAVPEPASMLVLGGASFVLAKRRKRQQ